VFLSGAAVGALGHRWYTVNGASAERGSSSAPRAPRDPAEVRKRIVAEMTQAVKLTPEQVGKFGDILDNTRAQFEEVHHEMNAKGKAIWQDQVDRVNAILTAEQRPLYQQLRDKHTREREAREKRRAAQPDATRK
jgi:hypothetical protein